MTTTVNSYCVAAQLFPYSVTKQKSLIRKIADAKGLVGNFTEKKLLEFFYS